MANWWTQRRLSEPEWMDAAEVSPEQLGQALRFIRRVNTWLGYTQSALTHLDRLTAGFARDRVLRVLDVATGSADVPEAIAAWAKKNQRQVVCVGIDLHQATLDFAADATQHRHPLVRADALQLPFADGAFDIVMTSMFTHHLPDAMVVKVFQEMDRVASRGIIVADLLRSRRAHAWITLFAVFSNPMIKHDARVSVRQAFTIDELMSLMAKAGIDYVQPTRHTGHRVVISGQKRDIALGTTPCVP